MENIGKSIVELDGKATAAGLTFHALGCSRSASDRGYSTWDDGQGKVISTCTERSFRIRDISWLIGHFVRPHPVLAADAGLFVLKKQGAGPSFDRADKTSNAPPVTILVTKRPYSTGYATGAISLAVASAHAGILTRVIFIEDGIYALTGNHRLAENTSDTTIQELVNMVAGSENLHFFAFMPSFQKRGVQKEKSLNAVLDIGCPGLGKIFFYPPGNVQAEHQRMFIF